MKPLLALLFCAALAFAAPGTLKVRLKSATIEMPLDQYVAAVLAGECSTFRSDEAIKAMAVAARSYALHLRGRHAAQGYDLCSTTHCQRLDPDAVTPRLASLAAQTAGELLWFEGKPAFACYSRKCGGTTEDASAVWGSLRAPFLRSHTDPYCPRQGAGEWHWTVPAAQIATALQQFPTSHAARYGWHRHRPAHRLRPRPGARPARQYRPGARLRQFLPLRHRPRPGLQHRAQRSLVRRARRQTSSSLSAPAKATESECASSAPTRWASKDTPIATSWPSTIPARPSDSPRAASPGAASAARTSPSSPLSPTATAQSSQPPNATPGKSPPVRLAPTRRNRNPSLP